MKYGDLDEVESMGVGARNPWKELRFSCQEDAQEWWWSVEQEMSWMGIQCQRWKSGSRECRNRPGEMGMMRRRKEQLDRKRAALGQRTCELGQIRSARHQQRCGHSGGGGSRFDGGWQKS